MDRASILTTNLDGEYVPAIPLPYYLGLPTMRNKCHCGAKFWTTAGYRGHYALVHILKSD